MDSPEYNIFPSQGIGGPPGLYKMRCPVPSKSFAEYCVVSVANGATSAATVLVSSTDQPPATFDTSGTTTYDDTSFQRQLTYIVSINNSFSPPELWEQMTSPQGYIFVRIIGSVFTFVTIKFREKILKAVPAPAVTVDPYAPEQYHYQRSKKIENMVLGREGEIEEYSQYPGKPFKIRR